MVSCHYTNVDDHKHCGRVDIRFFHLSRDDVIKRTRDFEAGVPPT